ISRIAVLGDDKIGKTILHHRAFGGEPFSEIYTWTIGVEFFNRINTQNLLRMHSWDSGGNERFREIVWGYHKTVKSHFYCFDLNNHNSFENAKKLFYSWKERFLQTETVESFLQSNESCILLLGLKSDLEHKVTRDE
ncbi:rab family small GTPase, partial [Naegleria gruberi]